MNPPPDPLDRFLTAFGRHLRDQLKADPEPEILEYLARAADADIDELAELNAEGVLNNFFENCRPDNLD